MENVGNCILESQDLKLFCGVALFLRIHLQTKSHWRWAPEVVNFRNTSMAGSFEGISLSGIAHMKINPYWNRDAIAITFAILGCNLVWRRQNTCFAGHRYHVQKRKSEVAVNFIFNPIGRHSAHLRTWLLQNETFSCSLTRFTCADV